MEGVKNLKVSLFIVFGFLVGLVVGALGIYKSGLASKIAWLGKLTGIDKAQICTPEAMSKSPALFISCGGFLE